MSDSGMVERSGATVTNADGPPSCILVVEDDEALRVLLASLLRSSGYQVVEASDGSEALHFATERSRKILLLLSDICMPGITGIELARRLTTSQPHIKVVLMSGTESGSAAEEEGWEFIRKPFSPPFLLRRVRQILAEMEN